MILAACGGFDYDPVRDSWATPVAALA